MKITGKVTDLKTKEGIPALVFKSDATGKNLGVSGTAANIDGNYTLDNINKGDYVTASMLGLKPLTKTATETPSLNFELSESAATMLQTFEVIAEKPKPKPPVEKPMPKKENWFKRNQKAVVIASVSIIALIMGVLIAKSAKN
jgi:hypothetical protein